VSDSSNAAFQEIDEAVRKDDLKAWWKRWGNWVVAGVVLAVVAVAAQVGWRQYQNAERARASMDYSAAIARIADDPKQARAELDHQAASAPEPYRELAALAAAQLLDTPDQQVAALLAVAPKLSPELSDLALALAGYRSVDGGKLGALAGQLEAMTGPQRPFRVSARELQSLEALHKGDVKTARDIWQQIIRDPDAPPGAPQRAQAMLQLYPAPAEAKK
jgi:hypothetical protein